MSTIIPPDFLEDKSLDVTLEVNDQDQTNATSYTSPTFSYTAPSATDRVYVVALINAIDSANISPAPTISIDGSSSGVTTYGDTSGQLIVALVSIKEITSGTSSNIVVSFGQTMVGCGIRAYTVRTKQGRPLQVYSTNADSAGTANTLSVNTRKGGAVFVTAMCVDKGTAGSWVGATERVQFSMGADDYSICADYYPVAAEETPRTVSFNWALTGNSHRSYCVSLTAGDAT